MHDDLDDNETSDYEGPSKSAMKRQMTALQELGEALADLSEKQLDLVPIDDERLIKAIGELRGMRSNSAAKRHRQWIGKLMRDIDPEPIIRVMRQIRQQKLKSNNAFHELEQLRDAVLEAGLKGVELVMNEWPEADRQHLRQLVTQYLREQKQGKPPAASRKLFKVLRELQASGSGSDSNSTSDSNSDPENESGSAED